MAYFLDVKDGEWIDGVNLGMGKDDIVLNVL